MELVCHGIYATILYDMFCEDCKDKICTLYLQTYKISQLPTNLHPHLHPYLILTDEW